jgi:hypothetical protein
MATFQSLPAEIRHKIYFLATPARVVHVKADFLYSSELDTLWRVSGYSGSFKNWLRYKKGAIAYFYSNSPIPVLLHTCFESRDLLMKMGYQLTFKTKSHGPRTWFNYDRDVLFKRDDTCEVAEFDPVDAIRVRQLAVDHFTGCLYGACQLQGANGPIWWPAYTSSSLYSHFKEFTALEELLLVDWTRNTVPKGLTNDTDYPVKPPSKRHRYDTENLWKCVKVEDSSLIRTVYDSDPREEYRIGPEISRTVNHHPAPGLADWGTFSTQSACLQSELVQHWKRENNSAEGWRAPRVTPVHLIDEQQKEILQQKQKLAVDELHKLRRYWALVLQERKERIDARRSEISSREHQYLSANSWEKICWIEKDVFS